MRKECHPLLSGASRGSAGEDGRSYKHGLSSAEMESLASVCEAIFPPLPLADPSFEGKKEELFPVQSFYQASGAQTGIPDETRMKKSELTWGGEKMMKRKISRDSSRVKQGDGGKEEKTNDVSIE